MDCTAKLTNQKLDNTGDQSGRKCNGSCGQWKVWSEFDKKANGLNGHDSRCKRCISRAKKSYKAKEKRKYKDASLLRSEIVGTADQDKINNFAIIIASSIMSLIDEGVIE